MTQPSKAKACVVHEVEIQGKDTGGIYQRLGEWLQQHWQLEEKTIDFEEMMNQAPLRDRQERLVHPRSVSNNGGSQTRVSTFEGLIQDDKTFTTACHLP